MPQNRRWRRTYELRMRLLKGVKGGANRTQLAQQVCMTSWAQLYNHINKLVNYGYIAENGCRDWGKPHYALTEAGEMMLRYLDYMPRPEVEVPN